MAGKTTDIPAYEESGLDEITAHVETLRKTFRSGRTKDVEFRVRQLRKLYWALEDNKELMREALWRDLRKSIHEADISEIRWSMQECLIQIANVAKWAAKDEAIPGLPLQFYPMRPRVRNEPLGSILIISPFNFPIQLTLAALIGAIAAGNTVIVKPSEHAPHAASVLSKVIGEALDPECYVCVLGAVPVSTHLLEHKFDKIVFTGGKKVGTIVAKKAAETLTPVLLELGGQNPAFITPHADVKLAARRLLWQKCLACGQLCLSQNYALVERGTVDAFVDGLKEAYKTFMPDGARQSAEYPRMINADAFRRLKKMLDDSKGKVVMGGDSDEADLFIEPTVVLVDDVEDSLMADETFGPVWSIMPYDTLDQAIDIANKVDPTPLALYVFGTEEENDKVLYNVTSGGATFNDGLFHAMTNFTPMGGVGSSGQGNYHGYYSFKAFSHQRSIARVPGWAEAVLRARYMPFSAKHLARYQLLEKKPDFDRNGDVVKGLGYWLSFVFTLGAKQASGGVRRWGLLILIYMAVKLKGESMGL